MIKTEVYATKEKVKLSVYVGLVGVSRGLAQAVFLQEIEKF